METKHCSITRLTGASSIKENNPVRLKRLSDNSVVRIHYSEKAVFKHDLKLQLIDSLFNT
jgi:hypothetical protein